MIRFGPAGNCDSFYAEGHKRSEEAPAWLEARGLNAYEYSFGRGVSLREETARRIAEEAETHGVRVSVHAPYYINLASPETEKREKSIAYIVESARRVRWLGGNRVVVHVGAQQKQDREEALAHCQAGLLQAQEALDREGLSEVHICPETMGKGAQIGNLAETLAFCQLEKRFVPCIDFAHLHALYGGALQTQSDFAAVLDEIEEGIGLERARSIHIHFSTIEYTEKGEKRHRTFAEKEYGPRFDRLAPLLAERGYEPIVICECSGTQAEDAQEMKHFFDGEMKEAPSDSFSPEKA